MKSTQTLSFAAAGLLLVGTIGLPAAQASVIQHVFVIAMENTDASQIYGNTTDAPYINNILLPNYAHATNWNDELPSLASEPHYLWMEAGTNAFSDHTFTTDNDPSRKNSTNSTAHLVTQIKNALGGVTWMTYQEGQNSSTGACPVSSSGFYAAKHNPFVFFKDVSGNPPSQTNVYCAAHSKPYTSLAADLAANNIASYVFITPNLCNDMHGASGCPNSNRIRSGDDWLSAELPNLITWANLHSSVILITWDEGSGTTLMPFLAIGSGVKANYAGAVVYDHKSIIKSAEEIFSLPFLSTVSAANDLADLFQPGFFP